MGRIQRVRALLQPPENLRSVPASSQLPRHPALAATGVPVHMLQDQDDVAPTWYAEGSVGRAKSVIRGGAHSAGTVPHGSGRISLLGILGGVESGRWSGPCDACGRVVPKLAS